MDSKACMMCHNGRLCRYQYIRPYVSGVRSCILTPTDQCRRVPHHGSTCLGECTAFSVISDLYRALLILAHALCSPVLGAGCHSVPLPGCSGCLLLAARCSVLGVHFVDFTLGFVTFFILQVSSTRGSKMVSPTCGLARRPDVGKREVHQLV